MECVALLHMQHIFRFKTGETRLVNKQLLLEQRCKTLFLCYEYFSCLYPPCASLQVMFVSKDILEVPFLGGGGAWLVHTEVNHLPWNMISKTKESRSGFRKNIYHKRFEPLILRNVRLKIAVVCNL